MPAVLASARTTLLGLAVIVALMVWALPGLAILVGYAVLVAYALSPVVSALEHNLILSINPNLINNRM